MKPKADSLRKECGFNQSETAYGLRAGLHDVVYGCLQRQDNWNL